MQRMEVHITPVTILGVIFLLTLPECFVLYYDNTANSPFSGFSGKIVIGYYTLSLLKVIHC